MLTFAYGIRHDFERYNNIIIFRREQIKRGMEKYGLKQNVI